MIYSIGYQKITVEQLKEIMKQKDIGLLVDVRSVPYSRNPLKYEFNKNRLIASLGISTKHACHRYTWMGDRCGGKQGPVKAECIRKLLVLNNPPGEHNLLLMCMENHPLDCHRYYDISKRLLDPGRIDVIHLFDGQEVKTSELMEAQRDKK